MHPITPPDMGFLPSGVFAGLGTREGRSDGKAAVPAATDRGQRGERRSLCALAMAAGGLGALAARLPDRLCGALGFEG